MDRRESARYLHALCGSGHLPQALGVKEPTSQTLEAEALRATELLAGKVVASVSRHGEREVLVQFTDGTRLFVDADMPLELSVT